MNLNFKIFLILVLLNLPALDFVSEFECYKIMAQTPQLDSLKFELKKAKHDTTRCIILCEMIDRENEEAIWTNYNLQYKQLAEKNISVVGELKNFYLKHLALALNNIGFMYYNHGNITLTLNFFNQSLKIQEQIGNEEGIATALNNIATIHRDKGNIAEAINFYSKSLRLREQRGNKQGVAYSLANIAAIYKEQGDIDKALALLSRSLKICEEINDKDGIGQCLNEIALIYQSQGDITNALEKHFLCLKLYEETGDKKAMAASLLNIGSLYIKYRKNANEALKYYNKSLIIYEGLEYKKGIAACINNIATIYTTLGDNPLAMQYLNRSLKIYEELGDKHGIASELVNLSVINFNLKDNGNALAYALRSMKLSKELGYPESIGDAAKSLYFTYKATGNFKLALENYELYIQMRDSSNNESTRKASIKSQLKYEYEKQAAADSVAHAKESEIKNMELAKQKVEIKAKKNQQYVLFGGLLLVVIFAGFMYNRFKVTQKQKFIIEEQKLVVEEQKIIVEEKQKEVLDSIRYAKRIQMAHLPSQSYLNKTLNKLNSIK